MADSSQPVTVSVVLPCFNGGPLLDAQLTALAAQRHDEPWELVFADNGSTDGSLERALALAERMPNVRVVDAAAERGQPYALNTGIAAARGAAILLCDADDEVAPGWLAAMATALKTHRFVAARVDHTKLNPPWLHWTQQVDRLPSLWYHPFLPYAAGATLGFQRSLFDEIGPFEPALPYLHDTEFCIRAQLRGVPIVLVPEAVVHYRRRANLSGHLRQARNYAAYNTLLARRHRPASQSIAPYVKQFLTDWWTLARLLRHGRRSVERRYEFTWLLGRQLGRIEGVVKHGGIPV
jgi:glycosyltransferase involved in cell wall biosynthesis